MGVPVPVPADPVAPGLPHPPCRDRVGQQVADDLDDLGVRTSVDHPAGLAVAHGFGRAAGIAGHHRYPGGRCLQEHDSQAFDVQTAAAGAAGHREHIGHRVVARQFGARDPAGEHHVGVDTGLGGQSVQGVGVGSAADDHQRRPVHPATDVRPRLDEHVLALAGHQPGDADHHGSLPESVAGAQFGARHRIRFEAVDVDAGGQVLQPGPRPECRSEPAPGVAADVGDDVGAVADATQGRPRAGQHRPAHLVAVGAGQHPLSAGVAGPGGQQRQRGGRAEPHCLDVVLADQRAHPAVHPGLGKHEGAGMTHHRERRRPVVILRAFPGRGVHDELVLARRRQPRGELLQIGLDAAAARREVIGHQQDPGHRP